jgi:hypothetical protein
MRLPCAVAAPSDNARAVRDFPMLQRARPS